MPSWRDLLGPNAPKYAPPDVAALEAQAKSAAPGTTIEVPVDALRAVFGKLAIAEELLAKASTRADQERNRREAVEERNVGMTIRLTDAEARNDALEANLKLAHRGITVAHGAYEAERSRGRSR